MRSRKDSGRYPADWVSYQDKDTGKINQEYITKGREKEYFPLWKKRIQYENNPAALQLIDKKLDEMTDWPTTRVFGRANDEQANMIDSLRMKGLSNEQILKAIDPRSVSRPSGAYPDLVPINPGSDMGGSPEEIELVDDEDDYIIPALGTGTGVDPRRLPGEWKDGRLVIPSNEGGKGLVLDLYDQPYLGKNRKKKGVLEL